jgi:lysyl-tRNA synthetase class I
MDRLALEIEEDSARAAGQTLVCASGISPSGPIHLGNLREVVTAHLVAEALRRRGRQAVHLAGCMMLALSRAARPAPGSGSGPAEVTG